MANESFHISGIALLNRGIGFFGEKYSVFSFWRQGQVVTQVKPVPVWLRRMKKRRFLKIPAGLINIFLHTQFFYTFIFLLLVELWFAAMGNYFIDSYKAAVQNHMGITFLVFTKVFLLFLMGLRLRILQRINIGRQYHGAEHQSIACSERGLPLTYKNIKSQSRIHHRCGSVLIFLVLPIFFVFTYVLHIPDTLSFLGAVIIATALKRKNYKCLQWSNTLGSALQHLTTKEPDIEQILVAQEGLQTLLALESEILA